MQCRRNYYRQATQLKLANDTFGRTITTCKLHKDVGRLYYGNNLHFECFGRHHRFVTASRGIDAVRERPESEWKIADGTFVLYHLFPNIQYLVNEHAIYALIRICLFWATLFIRDANQFLLLA